MLDERRVGHAGTLDPTATGLLPICVGQATRFVDYFHHSPRRTSAWSGSASAQHLRHRGRA